MSKPNFKGADIITICEWVYNNGNNQGVIDRLYNNFEIDYTQYIAVTNVMEKYEEYKNALSTRGNKNNPQ